MTSTQALELAELITQGDIPGPMVKLLFAFKTSRDDPEGEIMMDKVIHYFWNQTERCDAAVEEFATEGAAANSIAA